MRLFAWQPNGHGEYSFFVVSDTLENATAAVETKIAEWTAAGQDDEGTWFGPSAYAGWGTDYYTLTIADPGKVILNDNE